MQTYVADLKRSPCICSLYPAEMSPNTSLDIQHVLGKHESASLCTLHMTESDCVYESQPVQLKKAK